MKMLTHHQSAQNRPLLPFFVALFAIAYAVGCAECEVDYDCPANEICKASSGQCAAVECTVNQDCPPDRRCTRNQCVESPPDRSQAEADALVLDPVE